MAKQVMRTMAGIENKSKLAGEALKRQSAEKITTHLWFDKEAKEAAKFYVSIFGNSKIKDTTVIEDTPSGSVDVVNIDLAGQRFSLISAGPLFKFNPSVSFLVACDTIEEVDKFWNKLSKGGKVLMELGEYPFSKRYGWMEDKYGLSWQVRHMGEHQDGRKITPTMMFVGEVCGKAEEAINFYASVFHNASIGEIYRYEKGQEPDREGTIMHAGFTLEGQVFAAMDSARMHDFKFNEAISFMVHCNTQEEIDYYWERLSAVPSAEQCGWLKDRYGFSWQIVPEIMGELLMSKDKTKRTRMIQAHQKMKKVNIEELQRAFERGE